MAAASSSSIYNTHSWSNLPLDLLITIAERLDVRSDLLSFRFVCSDWRSAVPRPKHLPRYTTWRTWIVEIKNHRNLVLQHEGNLLYIPLPFPSTHGTRFLLASNGWLLFVTDYYSYYLFDPVSHQKHWLPPLFTRQKMRQLGNDIIINRSVLDKAVVSMSCNGGIAVAGTADTYNQMGDFIGNRFCFIEINGGKQKSWHISKKRCHNRVVGIVGGGDQEKRFYATDENWGVYLLEAGPLMWWRRFNLFTSKQYISGQDDLKKAGGRKKRLDLLCYGLREMEDGYLEVQGICPTRLSFSGTLFVKVHGSGLRIDSKDANVYGDKKWTDMIPSTYGSDFAFKPRF